MADSVLFYGQLGIRQPAALQTNGGATKRSQTNEHRWLRDIICLLIGCDIQMTCEASCNYSACRRIFVACGRLPVVLVALHRF